MKAHIVVVFLPSQGPLPNLEDAHEAADVEELVADAAVKRFDLRVLRRFPGIDEVQVNVALGTPTKHCTTCKFRAIVKSNGLWKAAIECRILEKSNHVVASKREGNLEHNAFTREIIDDVHRAKRSPDDKLIMHEVDRPSLIWASDRRNDVSTDVAHLALLSRPHLQLAFTIGSQQYLQSAPAEPRSLGRQCSKARRERRIDPRFEAVMQI